MPRTKKPAGAAVDRRNGRKAELVAVAGGRLALPDPPPGVEWCADAVTAWSRYWDDPVASALTPADEHLVTRWLEALNRYLLMSRTADQSPLVTGSQGQDVLNPLYRAAELAFKTVEACEKQIGIGPANRASLGIALLTEKRTLASMNAAYVAKEVTGAQDEDPRVARIDR
ncbi:P27 family phage terminase small subunit [Streptacidiphilus albus]|uniref:P27 family phage terminase small subunit n=1 Tax=Streptacidiphilus albus TaxID=105425 RepID=UPI00054B81D0|nr:P27 family phage terminase small subunit [Streptacidiphilus albus]